MAVHRVIARTPQGWVVRGDNCPEPDGVFGPEAISSPAWCASSAAAATCVWVSATRAGGSPPPAATGWLGRARWARHAPRGATGSVARRIQALPAYRRAARRLEVTAAIVPAGPEDVRALARRFGARAAQQLTGGGSNPRATRLVARRGARVVGFVELVDYHDMAGPWRGWWLFSLHVWPAYRGMGLGERLTLAVAEEARRRGAGELRLVVHADDPRAVRLYEKLGFTPAELPEIEALLSAEAESTGAPAPGPAARAHRRPGVSESIEIQDFALWEKLKARRAPLSFDLEVTARCNNDCTHCYIALPAGDREARAAELASAEILSLAEEAVGMGAVWCLLTGGEPLLRDDFEEIFLGLKRLGLLVSVFTNACLVTPAHVELFRRYPPRDIEVSVYGATRETYERVTRRPGSYDAFVRGLDLLLQSGVPVRLKAMALRSTVHELAEISAFCRARTKDYYRFDPLLHLRFDGDEARNAEIRAERLSPEEVVAVERADEERFGALERGCRDGKLVLEPAGGTCTRTARSATTSSTAAPATAASASGTTAPSASAARCGTRTRS